MDEYIKSLKDFNPNIINMTNVLMQEKPITIMESLPMQTAISDDHTLEQDFSIPKYMAIKVKRFNLSFQ